MKAKHTRREAAKKTAKKNAKKPTPLLRSYDIILRVCIFAFVTCFVIYFAAPLSWNVTTDVPPDLFGKRIGSNHVFFYFFHIDRTDLILVMVVSLPLFLMTRLLKKAKVESQR